MQRHAWRRNFRHPIRKFRPTFSSSLRPPTSLPEAVLVVLSHQGSLSECQRGWIYEVCRNQSFDKAVRLQNRFKISHPVNLMLWSYKTGHISPENLCMICQENSDYVSMWRKKYSGCFLCYLAMCKNRLWWTLVNTTNTYGDIIGFYSGDLNYEYWEATGDWQRKLHLKTR